MKNEERFDKWLRKNLDDYKPSASDLSKQRFLSSISSGQSSVINRRWLNGISALIFLAGLVVFIIALNTRLFKTSTERPTGLSQISVDSSNVSSEWPSQKQQVFFNTEPGKVNVSHSIASAKPQTDQGNNRTLAIHNSELPDHKQTSIYKDVNLNKETETKVSETTTSEDQTGATTITNFEESVWKDSSTDTTVSLIDNIDDDIQKEKDGIKHPDYGTANRYLGIFYRPGLMWNILENEKVVHSYGIEWQSRFFNGNYILGSGIGVSRSKGYYEYAVDYNEFLGTYQRLDSISFLWNAREFSMQQTYYTTEQTVHDTAVKTGYHKLNRDFVYLQIPIMMGYDVVRKEKYSIGIRFSPIMSVLMSKKPVDFQYEPGLDKVVQINRITPDRVRTNWQLNTGLNFSRRISENLQFEIEPGFTYISIQYMKSLKCLHVHMVLP